MCQRCFSLYFDPGRPPRRSDPSAQTPTPSPTPVEAGCSLFGHAYRNILTKYWVSATSTPRRGRLTGFAALHFAPSGGQFLLPTHPLRHPRLSPGTAGRLEEAAELATGAPLPFQAHDRKTRRPTAKGGTPKNSLPSRSQNIIYISRLLLFICRQTFSGSAGTRFR